MALRRQVRQAKHVDVVPTEARGVLTCRSGVFLGDRHSADVTRRGAGVGEVLGPSRGHGTAMDALGVEGIHHSCGPVAAGERDPNLLSVALDSLQKADGVAHRIQSREGTRPITGQGPMQRDGQLHPEDQQQHEEHDDGQAPPVAVANASHTGPRRENSGCGWFSRRTRSDWRTGACSPAE